MSDLVFVASLEANSKHYGQQRRNGRDLSRQHVECSSFNSCVAVKKNSLHRTAEDNIHRVFVGVQLYTKFAALSRICELVKSMIIGSCLSI